MCEAGLHHALRWYRTATMAKRISLILVIAVLAGLSFYLYRRHRVEDRLNSGEVLLLPDGNGRPDADGSDATQDRVQPSPASRTAETSPERTASPTPVANPAPLTAATVTPPAADSVTPNPPNGAAFAGTGRYQVYRQGNLTWRVNTDDGSTCILFATNEEWRKPVVYSHGCRNS